MKFFSALLALGAVAAFKSGQCNRPSVMPPPKQSRLLTSNFLMTATGANITGLVNNTEFLPYTVNGNPQNPSVMLDGTISLAGLTDTSRHVFNLIWSDPNPADAWPQPFDTVYREHLGPFSFQYVQSGADLLPLEIGWIPNPPSTAENPWEYILSPSRCWHEANDGPYDRCTIVFTLTESQQNCLYNGLMTFLVHPGTYHTSQAYYQISSTNCGYYQFYNYGLADIIFTQAPRNSLKSAKVAAFAAFNSWKATKMPVQDILTLPNSNPSWTHADNNNPYSNYTDHASCSPNPPYPYTMTFYSVVYDNTLYAGPVSTAAGPHPYPDYNILPLYSWTKSFFGSFLVGVLDQKFGCTFPSTPTATDNNQCILDLIVANWIPEADSTWSDTTVRNLMDQSSNHYDSLVYGADEGSLGQNMNFFYPYIQNINTGNQERLNWSLTGFDYHPETPPGTIFNYNTKHYYLLGVILDAISQTMLNQGIVDVFHQDICGPLQLSDMFCKPRVSEDADQQVFGGYGMYGYPDDMAKLARFWTFSGGMVNGQPLISAEYYAKVTQQDPTEIGVYTLRTQDPFSTCYPVYPIPVPTQRYNLGFWFDRSVGPGFNNYTGCADPGRIAASGYGGEEMSIIPGKFAYMFFNDNYDYNTQPALGVLFSMLGCPNGYVP